MSQMSTGERLVHMANQIARNLAGGSVEQAALATADHIATYWDPRMKAQIFAIRAEGGGALGEAAGMAIDRLREGGAPAHQTEATVSSGAGEAGRSDAG